MGTISPDTLVARSRAKSLVRIKTRHLSAKGKQGKWATRDNSTEFAALLAQAELSQAAFARLASVTARQVNNWARGRAAVPQWAALLAAALLEHSAEGLVIALEEAKFSWAEVLGVNPDAGFSEARRAMTRLAVLYHPDKGGTADQMFQVNMAYEDARNAHSEHDARLA